MLAQPFMRCVCRKVHTVGMITPSTTCPGCGRNLLRQVMSSTCQAATNNGWVHANDCPGCSTPEPTCFAHGGPVSDHEFYGCER